MPLFKIKIVLVLVLILIPAEVFSMEWTKTLPLAKAQSVYPSSETSRLCRTMEHNVLIYKDGARRGHSIVFIDNDGNIKNETEHDIWPEFISCTAHAGIVLGINTDGHHEYDIINKCSIVPYKINKTIISLFASSLTINNKNIYIIFYVDINEAQESSQALVSYMVIDGNGYILHQDVIHEDISSVLSVYTIDNKISILTMDNEYKIFTITLDSNYKYVATTETSARLSDESYLKKIIFLSGKILFTMEDKNHTTFLHVLDIKSSKFSTVNFHNTYRDVRDIVLYTKDSIAFIYDKYILIYNLEYKKEYVADLSYLNMQIEHLLPVEDNSVIIAGYIVEPTGGFHPILKRVTIHPVPR